MKLHENITSEDIIGLGFVPFDDDFAMENNFDDEGLTPSKDSFIYTVGHSRRGQAYYLIIRDRNLNVYASKPDGYGCEIALPEVIKMMIAKGYIA